MAEINLDLVALLNSNIIAVQSPVLGFNNSFNSNWVNAINSEFELTKLISKFKVKLNTNAAKCKFLNSNAVILNLKSN